jgi:hypothetical protein
VTRACGAGSDCGACRPALDEIIAQASSHASAAHHEGEAPRARHSVRHAAKLTLVKTAASG